MQYAQYTTSPWRMMSRLAYSQRRALVTGSCPVTQRGGKSAACKGMISMAWERADQAIRHGEGKSVDSHGLSVIGFWPFLPIASFSFSHETPGIISQSVRSTYLPRSNRCTLALRPHRPRLRVSVTLAASPVVAETARRSHPPSGGQASRTVFPSSRDLAGTDIEKERPPASPARFPFLE